MKLPLVKPRPPLPLVYDRWTANSDDVRVNLVLANPLACALPRMYEAQVELVLENYSPPGLPHDSPSH